MHQQITEEMIAALLRPRSAQSYKGSFGHALLCCGSARYRGAARLAAEGCARMGAGLVTLGATERVLSCVLPALPEVICLPLAEDETGGIGPAALPDLLFAAQKKTALLFGCGLGQSESTQALLRGILSGTDCPLVLDADGLSLLAKQSPPPSLFARGCVLTPHPGELARLVGWEAARVAAAPDTAALLAAKKYDCVTLCKTHRTLVALPNGAIFENTTGNAGLARGGSGDYLAGMITALLAQGYPAADAALCGVFLHGAAADRCAKRRGGRTMLPHDLSDGLGELFARECEI